MTYYVVIFKNDAGDVLDAQVFDLAKRYEFGPPPRPPAGSTLAGGSISSASCSLIVGAAVLPVWEWKSV